MIDTLHLTISHPLPSGFLESLDNYHHTSFKGGAFMEAGNIHNLRVKSSDSKTKVAGSLAVFYHGDNVTPFGLGDVEPALSKLSETLHLPIEAVSDAAVTRLDVGANLDMPHPVSTYLRALPDPDRMVRRAYARETVTFVGDGTVLLYYDKAAEVGAKQPDLLPLVEGRNLLRFEVQWKHLGRLFGKNVTARLLMDGAFYDELKTRWAHAHRTRIGRPVTVLAPTSRGRAFKAELAYHGVAALGGEEAVLESIADTRRRGYLTSKQALRACKYVKGLRSTRGGSDLIDAMKELNEAIEHHVAQI